MAENETFEQRFRSNLSAFEERDPALATTILRARADSPYTLYRGHEGAMTILFQGAEGAQLILSEGGDPQRDVGVALGALDQELQRGAAIAMCGVGDGYLLAALADTPANNMGMHSLFYVLIPDPAALVACLMLHDYSQPNGPIRSPHFRWYVGARWLRQLQTDLAEDLYLPVPVVQAKLPPHGADIAHQLEHSTDLLQRRASRFDRRIANAYKNFDGEQLCALLGDSPPRPPRAALITTRFSTVLQYATRDFAAALQQLGWETHVIIEESSHHRVTPNAMRHCLASFLPDLFIQIDHLRYEHADLLPEHLPFISWAQDLLPNLLSRKAGTSLGAQDFLLTFDRPLFVDYGYPQERCIPMPLMLTLPDMAAGSSCTPGPPVWQHDLVYVSNMSNTPDAAFEERRADTPSWLLPLVDACWQELRHAYGSSPADGAPNPTATPQGHGDLQALVERVAQQIAFDAPDATVVQVTSQIFNPLNSLLFRQQGLAWVADAANAHGWDLAIYGRGWEHHPRFRSFAQGPIEHGAPLRDLTRRSQINLNLEPYPCFSHQRLLDGVAAGGFFLVREHTSNTAFQELANLLDEHAGPDAQDLTTARSLIASEWRPALEKLITTCTPLCYARPADPVRLVRSYQEACVLVPQTTAIPHLDEISFGDPRQCVERITEFLQTPARRARIAEAQWDNIRPRLTFPVAMKRVIGEIRQHLQGTIHA